VAREHTLTMARLTGSLVAAAVSACALLGAAPSAWARDGDDGEVRARGVCTGGATARLKLKGDDGRIEVELEVDQSRSGVRWRVVLVHERRVAWRGSARTAGASGSFELQRRLRDLPGFDTVTARASAPGGPTCRVSATLDGD
jgi:hypothetical protein